METRASENGATMNDKCEIISREEVYFTGKENIEGYACLVNMFLKSLLSSSTNPCLINVDNDFPFEEKSLRSGQLFFQSTLKFQDTFTTLLQKQLKELKTINVKVNFKKLQGDHSKQLDMCNKTFAYLGIEDTILVK